MGNHATIHRLKWWQRLLVVVVGFVLRLYWATLKIRLSETTKEIIARMQAPTVIAFWHDNLFVAYPLNKFLKNNFQMYGLVSPSRDGAWLAALLNFFKIGTIRGSSTRNGSHALDKMFKLLCSGGLIAITPDGPRGPRYVCKNGVAIIAKRAQANLVMVSADYMKYFTLPTWDRFKIPYPFSNVTVDTRIITSQEIERMSSDALTRYIEQTLLRLQKVTH